MPTSHELTDAYHAAKQDFEEYYADASRHLDQLSHEIVAQLGGGEVQFVSVAGVTALVPGFTLGDRGILRINMRVTLIDRKQAIFALQVFKNPGWKYTIEGVESGQPLVPASEAAQRILAVLQDQVRNEFRDWMSGRPSQISLTLGSQG